MMVSLFHIPFTPELREQDADSSTGKIDTLKHVKKDVAEMGKGTECGIGFEEFQDLKQDDQIQTYEIVKEKRKL